MEVLRIEGVNKHFKKKAVLEDLSLSVSEGEFLVLLGIPASGKSTLLRLVMGLDAPDSGNIFLRGEDTVAIPPGKRRIGYVPQSFALFPEKSVFENILYPLALAHEDHAMATDSIKRVARLLHIDQLLEKKPTQISGGEKQRVAIARGLVVKSDLYILDDPLAGLDFKLREQFFDDLRDLQESMDAAFFYSTSDAMEAMALGTRIALLVDGAIAETGAPNELYRAPSAFETTDMLSFPETNALRGTVQLVENRLVLKTDLFACDLHRTLTGVDGTAREVIVSFKPEALQIGDGREGSGKNENLVDFEAETELIEDIGAEAILHFNSGAIRLCSIMRYDEASGIAEHQRQKLSVHHNDIMLFDPATKQVLGRTKDNSR